MPELNRAEVGSIDTGKDPKQRRLSSTVETHDQHPFASVDIDIDIDEHHIVAKCLSQANGAKRCSPRSRRLGEAHRDRSIFPLDRYQLVLEFANPGLPGPGPLGHLLR